MVCEHLAQAAIDAEKGKLDTNMLSESSCILRQTDFEPASTLGLALPCKKHGVVSS